MGRWDWVLKSSKIVPYPCYGEEKDVQVGDRLYLKVSFTQSGWLEQVWEIRVQMWHELVEEDVCVI